MCSISLQMRILLLLSVVCMTLAVPVPDNQPALTLDGKVDRILEILGEIQDSLDRVANKIESDNVSVL